MNKIKELEQSLYTTELVIGSAGLVFFVTLAYILFTKIAIIPAIMITSVLVLVIGLIVHMQTDDKLNELKKTSKKKRK